MRYFIYSLVFLALVALRPCGSQDVRAGSWPHGGILSEAFSKLFVEGLGLNPEATPDTRTKTGSVLPVIADMQFPSGGTYQNTAALIPDLRSMFSQITNGHADSITIEDIENNPLRLKLRIDNKDSTSAEDVFSLIDEAVRTNNNAITAFLNRASTIASAGSTSAVPQYGIATTVVYPSQEYTALPALRGQQPGAASDNNPITFRQPNPLPSAAAAGIPTINDQKVHRSPLAGSPGIRPPADETAATDLTSSDNLSFDHNLASYSQLTPPESLTPHSSASLNRPQHDRIPVEPSSSAVASSSSRPNSLTPIPHPNEVANFGGSTSVAPTSEDPNYFVPSASAHQSTAGPDVLQSTHDTNNVTFRRPPSTTPHVNIKDASTTLHDPIFATSSEYQAPIAALSHGVVSSPHPAETPSHVPSANSSLTYADPDIFTGTSTFKEPPATTPTGKSTPAETLQAMPTGASYSAAPFQDLDTDRSSQVGLRPNPVTAVSPSTKTPPHLSTGTSTPVENFQHTTARTSSPVKTSPSLSVGTSSSIAYSQHISPSSSSPIGASQDAPTEIPASGENGKEIPSSTASFIRPSQDSLVGSTPPRQHLQDTSLGMQPPAEIFQGISDGAVSPTKPLQDLTAGNSVPNNEFLHLPVTARTPTHSSNIATTESPAAEKPGNSGIAFQRLSGSSQIPTTDATGILPTSSAHFSAAQKNDLPAAGGTPDVANYTSARSQPARENLLGNSLPTFTNQHNFDSLPGTSLPYSSEYPAAALPSIKETSPASTTASFSGRFTPGVSALLSPGAKPSTSAVSVHIKPVRHSHNPTNSQPLSTSAALTSLTTVVPSSPNSLTERNTIFSASTLTSYTATSTLVTGTAPKDSDVGTNLQSYGVIGHPDGNFVPSPPPQSSHYSDADVYSGTFSSILESGSVTTSTHDSKIPPPGPSQDVPPADSDLTSTVSTQVKSAVPYTSPPIEHKTLSSRDTRYSEPTASTFISASASPVAGTDTGEHELSSTKQYGRSQELYSDDEAINLIGGSGVLPVQFRLSDADAFSPFNTPLNVRRLLSTENMQKDDFLQTKPSYVEQRSKIGNAMKRLLSGKVDASPTDSVIPKSTSTRAIADEAVVPLPATLLNPTRIYPNSLPFGRRGRRTGLQSNLFGEAPIVTPTGLPGSTNSNINGDNLNSMASNTSTPMIPAEHMVPLNPVVSTSPLGLTNSTNSTGKKGNLNSAGLQSSLVPQNHNVPMQQSLSSLPVSPTGLGKSATNGNNTNSMGLGSTLTPTHPGLPLQSLAPTSPASSAGSTGNGGTVTNPASFRVSSIPALQALPTNQSPPTFPTYFAAAQNPIATGNSANSIGVGSTQTTTLQGPPTQILPPTFSGSVGSSGSPVGEGRTSTAAVFSSPVMSTSPRLHAQAPSTTFPVGSTGAQNLPSAGNDVNPMSFSVPIVPLVQGMIPNHAQFHSTLPVGATGSTASTSNGAGPNLVRFSVPIAQAVQGVTPTQPALYTTSPRGFTGSTGSTSNGAGTNPVGSSVPLIPASQGTTSTAPAFPTTTPVGSNGLQVHTNNTNNTNRVRSASPLPPAVQNNSTEPAIPQETVIPMDPSTVTANPSTNIA